MIYYRKTLFGCGPKLTAVHKAERLLEKQRSVDLTCRQLPLPDS